MATTFPTAQSWRRLPKRGMVIAIDGPAGAGKSTLARRLATELGLPYINTGAMYRALASRALARGADPDDEGSLVELARSLRFSMGGSDPAELLVDLDRNEPPPESPEVESIVSRVARHPGVREGMRAVQRTLGRDGSVIEGRDIGGVVFPDADVKIFLSAPTRIRAERREQERGGEASAGEAIVARDAVDARTNPLLPAADAALVDTTSLDADETFRRVLDIVRGVIGNADSEGHDRAGGKHPPAGRTPMVSILGRPNVGKSTLLNRLIGRREAIVHPSPGVTRDRIERSATWDGRSFVIVDTGGITDRPQGLDAAVAEQAASAARDADVVLLVVDATTGITAEDEALARRLRRGTTPVVVVANKVDSEAQEPLASEFHSLGLGEPLPVSALHGRGSADLLDRILALLPSIGKPEVDGESSFCLVGRPNVGKSSLFNRLVRQERAVVHDEPGTTRDAIDTVVEVDGRALRFVDTAGFRRAVKTRGIEYYGLLRAVGAIDRAHVALLVVDASEGVTGEDKHIAARVGEAGRGLVVALNKWDLVPSEERAGVFLELSRVLEMFPGTPVLRTSARTGLGVGRLVPALLDVHEAWTRRVPTAEVNRVLEAAVAAHPPPRGHGRLKYGTQASAGPPTFVLFGAPYPGPAYRRYLENTLRREFGFSGVPVRISFRGRESRAGAGRAGRHRPRGR